MRWTADQLWCHLAGGRHCGLTSGLCQQIRVCLPMLRLPLELYCMQRAEVSLLG